MKAIRAFEKAGYWIGRQGKHVVLYNGSRTLIVPRHNPLNSYTLAGIVKAEGMTVEEFKKLL